MSIITAAVVGSICKELAKLLVNAATDSKAAAAIAGELAGAAGKSLAEKVIPRVVAANVGPVEDHPEFRGLTVNDREAVRIEVVESIKPAIDRAFLGPPPYKVNDVVERLVRARGHKRSPVGFSADCASMYRHALEGAVRAVIKVAESAPEWHAANAAEVHAKLDRIADSLDAAANAQTQVLNVLDFLKKSVADLNAGEFKERRDFLELYYRVIIETLDKMELYGLDVQEDNPARSQRLSVAYISLNLTAKDAGKGEGSRSWESVLDTLEPGDSGRLLVRGDAGMGKTTLLRWAAIAIASQVEPEHWENRWVDFESGATEDGPVMRRLLRRGDQTVPITQTWRGKVPLLVILRECPDGKFPDLDQFPKFVSSAFGTPPPGFVRWLLDQGKALVMIDGFDEVPTGEPTRQTSKAITEHLEAYGKQGNLFIATSRPLVKDPAWITQLGFREAVIAPMTDPERDALIHKWHAAVLEQTKDEKRRAEIGAMPADLIQQLNNRPAIARLATVPLLCAMICAQSGPMGSKLPESEFAIINKLAEAMLWVRDRDRAVPKTGTPWDELTEDKRLAVVARLAHYLIAQGKAAVPSEDAIKKIVDALRFAGRTDVDAKRDAPAILNRMGDRGGIIRVPEGGLVEFAHKTFCEFLSAFQFVEDQDTRFLGEHAPEPGPSNVCRFTAGVKNRKYTEELIGRVLDGRDSPEERGVVALRMKLAAPTLDPKVQDRVKTIEDRLIPPQSPTAAKAIADLGDDIVGRLVFTPGMKTEQQIMNATALSQMRSEKAMKALAGYAATAESQTLVELVCRAVNPLSVPWVRRAMTWRHADFWFGLSNTISDHITDAAVADWLQTDTGLKSLTTLNLTGTRVTDTGVQELCRAETDLMALTTLNLADTRVTDAGVKELARAKTGLKALTMLDITSTRVTDAGVKELCRAETALQALTTLYVGATHVTDASVKELARADTGLKALTALGLYVTRVTDAGVKELCRAETGLKALTVLSLTKTYVTDAGVKELCRAETGLKKLTTLHLAYTRVTDAGVKDLSRADTGLKALSTLDLGGSPVTDAGVKELCRAETGLKKLTTLDLHGTLVTDAGVAMVKARWPGITVLR